jgi:hypothetical protein
MATYAQEQAEDLLKYYQGMSGTARKPTALSSREEQQAFQAQEVRGGRAPVETLPEQYGGRPTGESRRAIRMQEAYDASQAQSLQQQRIMQQMEQARISEQREGWRYTKEQNEYTAKQKLDALGERDAAQESFEVNSIASGLETIDLKNDPEAGLKIDQLVLENPLGAAREDIAKRLEAARRINGTYGIAATTKAEQEAGKAKSAIINKALGEGVTEAEIEATRFADPETAVVDYDYGKIERLAAKKAGERKDKEPEEKEGYTPTPLAQAEDQLAEAKAEFEAISEDADGEQLVSAQKKLAAATVRAERAREREGAAPTKKTSDTSGGGGYITGRTYGGLTYLGGDPNKESSWKKK